MTKGTAGMTRECGDDERMRGDDRRERGHVTGGSRGYPFFFVIPAV